MHLSKDLIERYCGFLTDDPLTEEERASVGKHLLECRRCALRVKELETGIAAMRDALKRRLPQ